MPYSWHFEVIGQYAPAFWAGLQTTIALSVSVIFLSIVGGIGLAVLRKQGAFPPLSSFAGGLIEFLRAIPKLVILIWIYYAFPTLSGIRFSAFETAVIAFSIISAAFVAEIIRAGMESIPSGQIDAAQMLGLSHVQILRHVVLPQSILRSVPSLAGEFSTIVKDTGLAMFIGVNELILTTNTASSVSYRPLELYTALGIIFLLIIFPLSWISKRFEFKNWIKKMKVETRHNIKSQ